MACQQIGELERKKLLKYFPAGFKRYFFKLRKLKVRIKEVKTVVNQYSCMNDSISNKQYFCMMQFSKAGRRVPLYECFPDYIHDHIQLRAT